MQRSWRGGANIVGWWLSGFGRQRNIDDIRRAVEKSINEQKPLLQWTGQGVLLNATVITQVHPNTSLRTWGVLGDGAGAIGRGKTPEEALLSAWKRGTMSARQPTGWFVDETKSTYIWVSLKPDGTLSTKGVPHGTMHDLDKRVRDNWDGMEAQRVENQIENLATWTRIADTAKARLTERDSRKAIDATLKAIVESQARVKEINERLKSALEQARAAQATAQLIGTMQGVYSASQLIGMAISEFNVPASEFEGLSTGVGVARKVESLRDGRVRYAAEMKVAFDGSLKDLQTFLDALNEQIKPAKPPAGIGGALLVTKP